MGGLRKRGNEGRHSVLVITIVAIPPHLALSLLVWCEWYNDDDETCHDDGRCNSTRSHRLCTNQYLPQRRETIPRGRSITRPYDHGCYPGVFRGGSNRWTIWGYRAY